MTGAGRTTAPRLRRGALATFFVSIGVNALLGVVGLLGGDFGETESHLLLTSLCVTGALVLGLVCLPAWERRLLGPVPVASTACGGAGFVLAIAAIWTDGSDGTVGKLLGTLFASGTAGALVSLLALARLRPAQRWAQSIAYGLTALALAGTLVVIWFDVDSDVIARALGVVLVLLAALSVTIPVLHRLANVSAAGDAVGAARPYGFCPYCATPMTGREGQSVRCVGCGRSFSVRPE